MIHTSTPGLLAITDYLSYRDVPKNAANELTLVRQKTHDKGLEAAVEELLSNPQVHQMDEDTNQGSSNGETGTDARRQVLDIGSAFDMHQYQHLMYGKVSPLDFKRQVIPTFDANADPVFQATRVEAFNGILHKGIFRWLHAKKQTSIAFIQATLSTKLRILAHLVLLITVDLFYVGMTTGIMVW